MSGVWRQLLVALTVGLAILLLAQATERAQTYDSLVYFEHYQFIQDFGFFAFLGMQQFSVGKVEPALYLLYEMLPAGLSYSWFLNLNYALLTIAAWGMYFWMARLHILRDAKGKAVNDGKELLFYFTTLFFWYPSYMNLLWVWRNYLAFLLFVAFIIFYHSRRYAVALLVVATSISFHFSAAGLLLLFFCCSLIRRFVSTYSRGVALSIIFIAGLSLGWGISYFFRFLGFMVSGEDIFNSTGVYTSLIVLLYLNFVLLYLWFVLNAQIVKSGISFVLYGFSAFLIGVAWVFSANHLMAMRFVMIVAIAFISSIVLVWSLCSARRKIKIIGVMLPGYIFGFASVFNYFF